MKSNSFRLPSKATAVLLLCTGLVASHPLALWAEDGVTTVQAVQQQQVIVKGTVSDAMGPVIGANVIEKGNRGNGTITDIDGKTITVTMEIFHKAMEIFFSSTQVWQTILFISIFLFLSP